MKNMAQMMKQAMSMRHELQKIQKELSHQSFEGLSAGGDVKVIVSGDQKIKYIDIKPEVLSGDANKDVKKLGEYIAKAANKALDNMRAVQADKMKHLAGQG